MGDLVEYCGYILGDGFLLPLWETGDDLSVSSRTDRGGSADGTS